MAQETKISSPFSIVVPTYREAENIPFLLERVDAALRGLRYEVLIVDDSSPDDTRAVCEKLSARYPVRLHVRSETPRCLSSSVITGLRLAQNDTLVVMDADLQHPPEKIPELVGAVQGGACDFALASRYVSGAHSSLGFLRVLNSKAATWLALPLTRVSDPMSGFFCFTRRILPPLENLDPVGYKIALEILVKSRCKRVGEVAIVFGERKMGQSKLSLREQVKYLKHLWKLYRFRFF